MDSERKEGPRTREDLNDDYIGNVTNPLVLKALTHIDRADFLPESVLNEAYMDHALDIAENSSNSQPTLVGKMIDNLLLTGNEKVLEVGTGSGWQAAIIARCSGFVHTIDTNSDLVAKAGDRLTKQGLQNVELLVGDGVLGLKDRAPFDAIIVGAHLREMPPALIEQLAGGGRIVAPIGKDPVVSRVVVCQKKEDRLVVRTINDRTWFLKALSQEKGGWTSELLERSTSLKKDHIAEEMKGIPEEIKEIYYEKIKKQAEEEGIENPNLDELLLKHFMHDIQLPDSFYDEALGG